MGPRPGPQGPLTLACLPTDPEWSCEAGSRLDISAWSPVSSEGQFFLPPWGAGLPLEPSPFSSPWEEGGGYASILQHHALITASA